MKIKDWIVENLWLVIFVGILITTAIVFFWLGTRFQYCLDFPNCPECQDHNMTSAIIKPLTYR